MKSRPALSVTARDAARWRALRNKARTMALMGAGIDPESLEVEAKPWFKVRNQADGADRVVVDIYAEIGYWGVSAADFVDVLRDITASTIELHVNSPGGDVYDGIAIYGALIDHPATVEVHVDALAASAASFIAQAGDHITMGRNSEMMIHDAWGMCVGNAADMLEMHALLDKASENIASIYAARAGNGGTKTWRARMAEEPWYSAQETVEIGLADTVAKTEPRRGTTSPAEDRHDKALFAFGARPSDEGTKPVEPPVVEVEPLDWDSIAWPEPKAFHLAMLDAGDASIEGIDTTPVRERLEETWDYDPDAFRGLMVDLVERPPEIAPDPDPPYVPSPTSVDIDVLTESMRKAFTP